MIFGEQVDLSVIDNLAPIFQNVGTFIPIYANYSPLKGNGYVSISGIFHTIFQNRYLVNKAKYALFDGIVERIRYIKPNFKENRIQNYVDLYIYEITED